MRSILCQTHGYLKEMVATIKRTILFGFMLAICAISSAQSENTPALERLMSIQEHQQTIEAILDEIEELTGVNFSYNPQAINADRKADLQLTRKSVREALNKLFDEQVQYKTRGNYIILTSVAPAPTPAPSSPGKIVISGYVVDGSSGIKVQAASIYEINSLVASNSNAYGYFELKLDHPDSAIELSINKKDYRDTTVTINPQNSRADFTIELEPKAPFRPIVDTAAVVINQPIPPAPVDTMIAMRRSRIVMANVKDTLYRKAQLSFIPFIGTNGLLSGNVVNQFSFNVLGGYSMGTSSLEVGGLFNVDRWYAGKAQLAGIFNIVGDSTGGAQLAGIFNMNLNKSAGLGVAGIFNATLHKTSGPRFAGIFNYSGGEANGPQFAGIANVLPKGNVPISVAGILNAQAGYPAKNQIAGIANTSIKGIRGIQIAGIVNTAFDTSKGVQIAGILNVANKIDGAQIGLLNVSDSIHGIPIGFLSFSRTGYHRIELSTDETFTANFSFNTGVKAFHNILMASAVRTQDNKYIWAYGYGVGTIGKLTRNFGLNASLYSRYQVLPGQEFKRFNMLNTLFGGFEWNFTPKFGITAGVTVNVLMTDGSPYSSENSLLRRSNVHVFRTTEWRSGQWAQWYLGAKIGLRFL